jgi:hypothetical protein
MSANCRQAISKSGAVASDNLISLMRQPHFNVYHLLLSTFVTAYLCYLIIGATTVAHSVPILPFHSLISLPFIVLLPLTKESLSHIFPGNKMIINSPIQRV